MTSYNTQIEKSLSIAFSQLIFAHVAHRIDIEGRKKKGNLVTFYHLKLNEIRTCKELAIAKNLAIFPRKAGIIDPLQGPRDHGDCANQDFSYQCKKATI